MSDAVQDDLRGFVSELIERNGGLVDWPSTSDHGQAILTPDFARRQGVDELLPLSSRSAEDGVYVSLASDFLDTAQQWLDAIPRLAAVELPDAYLKRGDLAEAVDRSFTWLNVKVRVRGGERRRVAFHTWWFHVMLASEDRWESRLSATINTRTDVEVEFPNPFDLWELEPCSCAIDCATSYTAAVAGAERRIEALAAGFLTRMDARLERDRKRLNEYYNALRREAKQKHQRTRAAVAAEQEDAGDRAVTLELRRKLAELDERYAIQATLRPIVLIETDLPVLEVRLDVHRKQAVRQHAVYWNPLTKAFDPIRCSACGQGAFSLAFTNERVEPLCARCAK